LIVRVVHLLWTRAPGRPARPIFERQVGHHWNEHLATLVDFWWSVGLKIGRYRGNSQAAYRPLPNSIRALAIAIRGNAKTPRHRFPGSGAFRM
jgi:truncated hemoglobin YjbI